MLRVIKQGSRGSGYYLYGSNTSTSITQVIESEILKFEIEVPEELVGETMTLRVRASRDGTAANDEQNDVWFNVVNEAETLSVEDLLVNNEPNEAEPLSGEFIKVFGGPNNGNWGYAVNVDGDPANFPVNIQFPESGRYVLEIAGRSQGFHIDWIELFAGNTPGVGSADSNFVPTDGQAVQLINEIPDQVFFDGVTDTFDLPNATFIDPNGDAITYAVDVTAANGSDVSSVIIDDVTGQLSGLSALAIDTYTVTITATDIDGTANDTFEIDIVDQLVNLVSLVANTPGASEPDVDGQFTVSLSEVATTDTVVTYTVGGTATADADYTALSGTVTITAGATTALIDVSVLDDVLEEGAESVIVTLTGATGDADLALGTALEATVTISDDDLASANEVSLTATTPGASEPGTNGQFTVSLSEVATTDTVVTYTVGGTATADADYTALSGTVTITAGATTALIDVSVLDDALAESPESVIVTLTGATGDADVVLGTATEATVTISDDDQTLSTITVEAEDITNVSVYRIQNDGDASGGSMLSLGGGSADEIGTATFTFGGASGNYNVVLGSFDENDGAPAASLEVSVNGGSIGTVVLDQDPAGPGANANTQVERSVAQVSINAGDTITVTGFESGGEQARFDFLRFEPIGGVSPQVSIVATADGAEPTVPGEFTVNLSQSVGTDTVVSYSVAGTATSGTDYTALTGTVTITAGATSATIAVPVLDDTDVEGTETVIVTLDSVAGDPSVELGGVTTATVDITDDDSVTTDNEVSLAATTPGASEPDVAMVNLLSV